MRATRRRGKAKAARKQPSSDKNLGARLREAESTLEAIRTGQVDALVVSGEAGDQTRTIEGATHPYFVLLNAMGDGAVLLDSAGRILFGNESVAHIAGVGLDALLGSRFQELAPKSERSRLEMFLREGTRRKVEGEFRLRSTGAPDVPVAIALSAVPLGLEGGGSSRDTVVLMAIIRNLTDLKAAEATRVQLLGRLISAEDDERRRIARELHDETGQSLTAILVGLRSIAEMEVPPKVRPVALRLRDIAAQTIEEISRLARGLHPAVLDDAGLEAAASRYVADYSLSFRAEVHFAAGRIDTPSLPPVVAATAYRILQEALTNAARHARANRVDVELKRENGAIEVIVSDDGVGFDIERSPHAEAGLGLHGMRERVALLGGSIEIESRVGRRTRVRAIIPVGGSPPPPPPPPPPPKGTQLGNRNDD